MMMRRRRMRMMSRCDLWPVGRSLSSLISMLRSGLA
jgi:hypothetical protein